MFDQKLLNMDLYWITVVLLVTGMVNALNLTSNNQQSEIANLKQEVNDLTASVRNLTSALNHMQAEFQMCMFMFVLSFLGEGGGSHRVFQKKMSNIFISLKTGYVFFDKC